MKLRNVMQDFVFQNQTPKLVILHFPIRLLREFAVDNPVQREPLFWVAHNEPLDEEFRLFGEVDA